MAASPGIVVVVGGSVISTSSDGATFTEQPALPSTTLSRARWTGASFVAVGAAGALLTSPDGLAWTARDSGTTDDVLDVAGSSTRAVIATAGGLRWSNDLATWHAAASPPPALLTRLVWTGSRFVGSGAGTIATSLDGDAWTVETTSAPANVLSLATSGYTVVAFVDQGRIYASTSPGVWADRQAPWGYATNGGVWDGLRFLGVMDSAQVIASP